jgi:hypothetical protein
LFLPARSAAWIFLEVSHITFFRPYNARLTREAVAPFRRAWKGQAEGGSGATFADKTNLLDPRAKGVTATLSRVESIVIRRITMFNRFVISYWSWLKMYAHPQITYLII